MDFAMPGWCWVHGPIVLYYLIPWKRVGVGTAYSRKLLNDMWKSGLVFLGQSKLWIMSSRSWREVKEAYTVSQKVGCNFPGCKSRKSILRNYVNDRFWFRKDFLLRLYYFYLFLNCHILYTEYIPPSFCPLPSSPLFCRQSHLYFPVTCTYMILCICIWS